MMLIRLCSVAVHDGEVGDGTQDALGAGLSAGLREDGGRVLKGHCTKIREEDGFVLQNCSGTNRRIIALTFLMACCGVKTAPFWFPAEKGGPY